MFAKTVIFLLFLIKCTSQQQFDFINQSPFKTVTKRPFLYSTNWVDCTERIPILFYYLAVQDGGNFSRSTTFKIDPLMSATCQQKTANTYGSNFDRGHLVPANHLDHSQQAILESNYMTNVIPQAASMNRGAWLLTEEITECIRDLVNLNVVGGIIMGTNTTNDLFLTSHGCRTPDWNFKIIENTITKDVVAWIIPNDPSALRGKLDSYLTTIKDIELKSGFVFTTFTAAQKNILQSKSWSIPPNCDYGK